MYGLSHMDDFGGGGYLSCCTLRVLKLLQKEQTRNYSKLLEYNPIKRNLKISVFVKNAGFVLHECFRVD